MNTDMEPMNIRSLPSNLVQRIQHEAAENDVIYRSRGTLEALDLSKIHYGHAEILDWSFRQLPDLRGARVLDIGIGEGQTSVLLARAGADVTGIDVSKGALERAAGLATRCGVTVDLRQMAGEDLQFDDASFDAILCMSAYHHMDLALAAREFARVLRPGGRLVMNEPLATNPPAWLYRRMGRVLSREATSEESPLRVRDLSELRRIFRYVHWSGMFLFSVGLFGLDRIWNNRNPFVNRLTSIAFKGVCPLDRTILKLPLLQRIAWRLAVVADR
jgi:2-polyprenyl-3-methyl-5-hydroxy-6-metoxy-1,4-benzoquinol methylase